MTFRTYNLCFFFFFFNDTATTEIYTLSLHDALPISLTPRRLAASAPAATNPRKRVFTAALPRPEQIEEFLPRHPLPSPDDLVLHHRDVRRRPTEGDAAELQEEPGKLVQADTPRLRRRIGV